MKTGRIGAVSGSSHFSVKGKGGALLIDEEIDQLKDCWKMPFGGLI